MIIESKKNISPAKCQEKNLKKILGFTFALKFGLLKFGFDIHQGKVYI